MLDWLKQRVKRSITGRMAAWMNEQLLMSGLDVAIDTVTGNQIAGDYLEFGVARGESFARAYHHFRAARKAFGVSTPIRYFAFDAFRGLPATEDPSAPTQYLKGAYAHSREEFERFLRNARVDLSQVVVVDKWYSDLGQADKDRHHLTSAALVYLDCNLYESARDALVFVESLLVDGSLIVIDDFFRHGCSEKRGIRRAWLEFLARNPHVRSTMIHCFHKVVFAINCD